MAFTSSFDCHPDERVHFEAVKYYSGNKWLPPKIGDPSTLDSYSAFGKSRLNLPDFYYLLAGKFTALLSLITGDLLLAARLFNVFLLFILVALAFKTPGRERLLYAALLITPQVWYLYSYVNSDAFAVFLMIVITTQLVQDNSLLKSYLKSPGYFRHFSKSIPLILFVTLLYFAKENYYLYFIFLFIWGAWFLYTGKDRIRLLVKYLIMVGVFLVLVLAKHGLDYSIYGPERSNDLREMQELMAGEEYKPSVRYIGKGHPSLNLKGRGVHYLELFKEPYNWHRGIFYSLTGAYDYLKIFGTAWYYRLMLFVYIVFAAYLIFQLWKEGWEARLFLTCTVMLAILILYLAFIVCWESAFQPQGRYLFPVLGPVAFLFCRYSETLNKKIVFYVLLLAIAALSAYSFIAYGLVHIPKA